jgi:uncharacterized protein (TIGR03083 family)
MPTPDPIDALRADREAVLGICAGLDDATWKTESGCAGWSVQDVIAHMGALYWLVVDPSVLPATDGLGTEAAQDAIVGHRRSWSADRVVDDYADVSAKALDALEAIVSQDFELPLGDLGTYHASQLALPYAFDHFTHVRADLFAPRGPLTTDRPPVDERRAGPALDWVEAALPQQNADEVESLAGTVELQVTGPGERTIAVGTGPTLGHVTGDALTTIRWITGRGTWDELDVVASGDDDALATVRACKVF